MASTTANTTVRDKDKNKGKNNGKDNSVIVHGITVDYSRDSLFDELGIKRLKESYMKEDENSPQERFAYVSKAFSSNEEHAQRLYDYSSKHWLSYSTPILSFGRSKRGLPISCFLPYLDDSAEGLVDTLFLTNCLASGDANLKLLSKKISVKEKILIYDNEVPRHHSCIQTAADVCLCTSRKQVCEFLMLYDILPSVVVSIFVCNICY